MAERSNICMCHVSKMKSISQFGAGATGRKLIQFGENGLPFTKGVVNVGGLADRRANGQMNE